MPPLSILHIDTELAWRGGQDALLRLALGLRDKAHRQTIVCPSQSELSGKLQATGLAVAPLFRSRELRRMLLAERFDIIHAHTGRAQNLAALSSLNLGVKRVVTRHVAFAPRNPTIHRLKYSLTCDGILAVSTAVRQMLVAAGVPAEKIEVIHTGVELPSSLPGLSEQQEARLHFGVPENAFVAGHMGAFTREKGQDVAIDAISGGNAYLILAGDGELADELALRAKPLGERVRFPGFVEDRAQFFAALDVFVMPSRSEAWGLAALEAMASGIPVIASNLGGLPEMIASTGWLIEPGNASALADALAQASDPVRRRNAGDAARARAAEFSVAKTVEQTEAFYRTILSAS